MFSTWMQWISASTTPTSDKPRSVKISETFQLKKKQTEISFTADLKCVDCSCPGMTKFTAVPQHLHVNRYRSFKVSQGHLCVSSTITLLHFHNLQQPKLFHGNTPTDYLLHQNKCQHKHYNNGHCSWQSLAEIHHKVIRRHGF